MHGEKLSPKSVWPQKKWKEEKSLFFLTFQPLVEVHCLNPFPNYDPIIPKGSAHKREIFYCKKEKVIDRV